MLRVVKALVSNGLFSVMSLLLSVLIARFGGSENLGMFGVAFAAYLLIQLIVRDAGANTLSAALPSARRIRLTAGRVSLMGLVFAVPVLLVGLIFQYPYMVVLGFTLHGICLYDYSKTLSLSLGDGKMAILQDSILFAIFVLAAALAFLQIIDPVGLMTVWAVAGAAIGYVVSFIQVFKLTPHWSGDPVELKTSFGFGLQSLIGSGSVHILTFLLAGIGGPLLVGSMRGASTIMGPANLITSSLQPLLITYFARTAPRLGAVSMRAVLRSSAGIVSVHLALVVGLVFVGYNYGAMIMGAAWEDSAPLLAVVALDSVFVALGCAPLAAHRSLWSAGRVASINTMTVFTRIPLVLLGAVFWGALGAVSAFLFVTFLNTSAWWLSLLQLRRQWEEECP
jgi:O-antigen/teichoic acid export membrane protein